MIICEQCGRENMDGSFGCSKCGAPRNNKYGIVPESLPQRLLSRLRGASSLEAWPVRGIDVSGWNQTIKWDIVAQKCQFAFIRAGCNDTYKDTFVDRNRNGASKNGIEWGLYWFCTAGYDYRKHARSFYDIYKEGEGKIPPTLDFEAVIPNYDNKGVTNWIYALTSEFANLAGVLPMVYTCVGWWTSFVLPTTRASLYRLWAAHWTNSLQPILAPDWKKYGKTWTFWQWSADGNGKGLEYGSNGDHDMDLDRFNGTVDEFNTMFGTNIKPIGEVILPLPAPIKPIKLITTTNVVNLRAQPSVNSDPIGLVGTGTQLPVTAQLNDWYKTEAWVNNAYTKDK